MSAQLEMLAGYLQGRRAKAAVAAIMLLLAALLFAMMIDHAAFQWQMRTLFPFWDMVSIVRFLDLKADPDILYLYHHVRDNEHRPIFPFLFYIWDRRATGDTGDILYPAIMIANAMLAVSFMGYVFAKARLSFAAKILVASIIGFAFFSIWNFENLTWQKQIHEILSVMFLSLGLLLAANISTGADKTHTFAHDLVLALLAGIVCLTATYSFGFGLAAWPVMLAHGLLARWRRSALAVVFLFAGFAIVSYYFTFSFLPRHGSPVDAITSPLASLVYVLRVISGPLSPLVTGLFAQVIAVSALTIAAWFCFRLYRDGFHQGTPPVQRGGVERVVANHAAMLLMSALVMALMLSLGRLTINSGEDSRYMVVAFVFWCALLLLLVHAIKPSRIPAIVLAAGVFAALCGHQSWQKIEPEVRQRNQNMYVGGVMATWRIPPARGVPSLYPNGPLLFEMWHLPRPPFQSFAGRAPFGWIGADLSALPGVPDTAKCFGHVDKVAPRPDAPQVINLHGWAFMAGGEPLRWLVVTGLDNRGLGVGKPGLRRHDVRNAYATRLPDASTAEQEYSGFNLAAVRESGAPVLLWGIDDSGRACRIAGPIN
jgi:hypothetical protein